MHRKYRKLVSAGLVLTMAGAMMLQGCGQKKETGKTIILPCLFLFDLYCVGREKTPSNTLILSFYALLQAVHELVKKRAAQMRLF